MRLFEAILLLGDLVTLVLLLIPRARAAGWALRAGFVTVLVLAAHLLFEGARWQMVPAYALTAMLLLTAWLLRRPPAAPVGHSWGRRLGVAAAAGLAALVLVVAAALPIMVPMFHLPTPTGPYAIGTLTYDWVDPNRADWIDKGARRELMVQVWYPAEKTPHAKYDTYLQKDTDLSMVLRAKHLPGFFLDHLKLVHTHAQLSAPAAENGGRFPVVIFSPGALGFRQHNMFQVEELVSHGYVVAGIDHPGAATQVVFPDGRRVNFNPTLIDIPRFFTDFKFADGIYNYLGQDVSFVLDKMIALDKSDPNKILTGRLDTKDAGALGMSLGGLAVAEGCRIDARFRACDYQDVFVPHDVMAARVQQPGMWFTRDGVSMLKEGWPQWEVDVHQSSARTAFEGARMDSYLVKLPGMFHVNYTDYPAFFAAPVARAVGLTGAIDWRRGHAVTNAYTVAFFDRYLKGKPEPLLDGPSKRFPEVLIEARHNDGAPEAATKN